MPLPRIPRAARAVLALAVGRPAPAGRRVAGPRERRRAAGDKPVMAARALLQGHVRQGSWFAIAVDLENAGPAVTGELRVGGGADSKTRFGTPVELATGSRKTYLLYAQPPTLRRQHEGAAGQRRHGGLRGPGRHRPRTTRPSSSSGVVSENPAKLVGELKLLPSQSGAAPTIATLTPADLPERIQAWAALDRLVWQDVDASALTPAQLAALRTWIAGGGRLVIVGGTAGADSLTGFPDELLPYRPDGILDIDPAVLRPDPRRGAGGCRHADRVCGRGRCRAGPGDLRRPRDRRGPQDRQRVRHAAGLRPHDVLAGRGRDLGHPALASPPAAANARAA